ncbi:BTAD domain-containing putative transcriptional regulator [Streptomyces sp. 21So2-11]|uniref:BTAD domain-containing putative transcriptional regulator n=1 Tax=Streptomyces sp. 21So2-11 TaxID=3144408 RepID=UPI003219D88D
MPVEFRLLGVVSVATESEELSLGPAKRRSMLAALLLRANTPVTVDQLIAASWANEPPAHARTVVQSHVSHLRTLLRDGGAAGRGVELTAQGPDAYVLHLTGPQLDAHRFDELVRLAAHQQRPSDSILMLREALALWRGPALAGTVDSEPLRGAAHTLTETRLRTIEDLAHRYGQLGEYNRAVTVLRAEAVAHPMRESLAGALMVALYRAGRRDDAIDWYHRTRRLLANELRPAPGRVLQEAYGLILRREEPDRTDHRPRTAPAPPAPPPREHLPAQGRRPSVPHLGLAPPPAETDAPGEQADEAVGLVNLAVAQAAGDDLAEARDSCARAVALAQQADDRQTEILAYQHLARHCLTAGAHEEALRHAESGLALRLGDGSMTRRVLLFTARGEALAALGKCEEALMQLMGAAGLAEREGYDEGACGALSVLLRMTAEEEYQQRYEQALARLAAAR